jgi:hypothetical protein
MILLTNMPSVDRKDLLVPSVNGGKSNVGAGGRRRGKGEEEEEKEMMEEEEGEIK